MVVHDAASTGFGAEAARYRAARPTYHPDLLVRFADLVGPGRVIEIGAGTGTFTGQLVAAGIDVVAVEPVEAMRAVLSDDLPDVEVRVGTAESLPADEACVDAVVVAQAFHWFDHGPALDEIARVLRTGGHLATVWNVKEGSGEWYRRYMDIIERHADDTPRHAQMIWRRAIDDDQRFELVDEWQVDNSMPMDADGVIGRALSTSFIAALPEQTKAGVASELRQVLAQVDQPVLFPYRGELQAWRKVRD